MRRFDGSIVLVTGAAGNLGRAVAGRLAEEGACLILMDRDREAVSDLANALGSAHFAAALDLTDREAVAGAVAEASRKLGPVDALCAIAGGFAMGKPVHETNAGDWQAMQDINLATLLCALAAVTPGMIERKAGKIVTVGAAAALSGKPNMGPYTAAKSSVMRVTESAASELKGFGINVNAVLPSVIDTPQNRQAMPDADTDRWVRPEALAAVIAFLISPDADSITGALIPVTGR